MSDVKPKLVFRSSFNQPQKSPSPTAKLMLNHGKPNFTINRTKPKNDSKCPFSSSWSKEATPVLNSSMKKHNGYIRPSSPNVPLSANNEVDKIILRRTKMPKQTGKSLQQDEEPEFVKAQKKIAERLATQNDLDFEIRKSGYFTHVMISPTTPTRKFLVTGDHKTEKATVAQVLGDNSANGEDSKMIVVDKNIQNKIKVVKISPIANENPTENDHELRENEIEEQQCKTIEIAKAIIEELVEKAENVAKKLSGAEPRTCVQIQNSESIKKQINSVYEYYGGDGHNDDSCGFSNGNNSHSDINVTYK